MRLPLALRVFIATILILAVAPTYGQGSTCANAITIPSLPYTNSNTTCGKVNDYTATSSCSGPYMNGEDIVYRYTPSSTTCVNLSTSGTGTYTGLFVLNACPNVAGTANCIAKAEATGGNPSLSGITMQAGVTYFIIIDTWPSPNCTAFNLSMTECPEGTTCGRPRTIASLPFSENNTTCGAGADYGTFVGTDYTTCGPTFNDDGADFVYAYTAPRNQCLNISLSGIPSRPEETAITVTTGCPNSAGAKCLGVSEGSGTAGPAPINGVFVFAGTTIYITIDADDFYYACTPFRINIDTCAQVVPQCSSTTPAGDACANATPICDLSGYCGSTSNSYTSDTPGNINSVFCGSIENNGWIQFVASATTATFNVYHGNCTNGDGIQALVLQANNCNNFVVRSNCYEPLTGSGYGIISATGLVPGQPYLIMIDGFAGDQCDYVISANSGVLLPVDAGPDRFICPGQSVTLTATNGNNIYQWQPDGQTTGSITVSPTTTSSYIVRSLSGSIGCPSPDFDTVTVFVTPTVVGDITGVTNANVCSGSCDGSAGLTITNGNPPYQIAWSTGATTNTVTGLCPGTTYTSVVTDANGCKSWDTLTMPPAVTAAFTATTPVCGALTSSVSTSPTSGTGNFTSTGPGTLTFTPTGGGNFSITASAYGTYAVTWTVSNGSCTNSQTTQITYRQNPTANFSMSAPVCGSRNTTLTVTPSVGTGTFTFSGPGAVSFVSTGANTFSATATNFGTYTLTYTVDNQGCTATQSRTIVFTAQPVAAFTTAGPDCDSLSFTATTTSSPGTGVWTSSSGSGTLTMNATGTNTFRGTVSNYGNYTLTWTVTNGSCSATTSQNLSFFKKPVANAGADRDICSLTATLSAIPSVGSGVWTSVSGPGSISFSNPSSPTSTVTATAFGTYVLRWSETNGTCPVSSDDISITFSQNPAGNAGPDQMICGLSTNLAGTATVGTGVWSGPGIASPGNPNTSVSAAVASAVTYTWTVSNGSCPALVDQVVVSYFQNPTPNAGVDQSVCGLNATLDAIPPTSSGSWEAVAGLTFSNLSNPKSSVTAAAYGSYSLIWQESNGPCPVRRDTMRLTFVEAPVPNAGIDQSVCGLTANLMANASSFNGTWTGPGSISSPANRTTTVTSSAFGTFRYVWTEFNAAPCPSRSDTVQITYVQQPIANGGPDRVLCGLTTTVNATLSVPGASGTWTAPAGVSLGTPNSPTTTVTAVSHGTYFLRWTESNTGVCPVSVDSVRVQFVQPTNPSAGPDNDICGLSTQLAAVPSFGTGSWSYTGPGILTFSSISDPTALITANAFGTYKLAWTEDNKPCAANSDSVFIRFFETPNVNAGASPDKVCGLAYQLSATATVGQGRWTWTPASGNTGTLSFVNNNDSVPNASVEASDYGTFYLIWTVSNGVCLPPADTVELTFFERPRPDAGPDQAVCDTLEVQLNGITSVIGQWSWTSETGGTVTFLPDANRPDPIAQVSSPGIYKMYFSETNDPICGVVTDSLTIRFLELPIAQAGPDDIACGSNYTLGATEPAVGQGFWSFIGSSDPAYSVSFDDDTLFNTQISLNMPPPTTGVDIMLEWVLTNGICPLVRDTVVITFREVPSQVDAGPNQIICELLTANLAANDNGAMGNWTIIAAPLGANASLGDPMNENTTLTVDRSGTYIIEREATVAGCPNTVTDAVTIDFRTKPNPNAGLDDSTCSTSYALAANALTGRISGVWTVVSGPGTAVLSDTLSSITTISLPDSAYGTYTLRRTESNLGCPSASDDIQITFRQRPIANAGVDQPFCGLIQNLFAIPSAASSSPSYSASWTGYTGPGTVVFADVNDPNTAVTADQFGFYTFYWTENNSICPASIDSVRIQLVNPSSPNAGPDEQICGLLDTLGAIPSFGQGLWLNHPSNSGSAVFVNPADPQTIVSVPDYGSYRFDWLEANSPCFANSDFTIINFNQQPLANAGINKDTCSLIAKLGALPSVSGPDYVGTWSGPLGAIFSDIHDPNATVDVSALGYGTYTFTWTEVNGSRCAVSISNVQVGFLETPVADVGTYPSEWCGKQLPLAAIPSVGSGVWTSTPSSGISISNLLDPQATAVVDSFGTYNLTWTETNFGFNGGQCSSSDNFTVTFYPQPTAYAGRDTAICGDQLNLTGFQSVATSNVTWTSPDEPVIQFSDQNALTTDVSTAGVFGLFQIVFTEATGGGFCTSSDTLILNLVQQPVANAGVGDSVCGLSHFLQASPTVGNGLWTSLQPGVSFIPGPGVAQPSLLVPGYGIYDFVWREENGAPCVASFDTVRVGFFDTPRPQAGIDFSICGDSARLAATSGGFAGVWSTINKPGVTFSNPNILAPVTRLNPATSSDYGLVVFKYTESNEDVCSASDEVSVIFIEQPVAEAGVNASLCGLDIYLNAVPGVGTGNWIFNGPDSLLTFFNNAATPNAEARMADFGTYEFIRLERNTPICPEDSDRVSITLFEQPVAFAGNDTVTCSRTINLSAIASVGSGQWTQVAGLGVATFANEADPHSQVTVDQQGSYTFRWTEVNGAVCASSSDDVVVVFEDRPLAQAGLDQEVCGLNTVLSATPSIGLGTWSAIAEPGWNLTFGDVNAPNTTLTSNRYGTAVLVWTEIQTAICGAQSDTLTVLFIEQPVAEAGPSDFQICGQNLNLEAQPTVGFGQWSLVSGPVNPTITSPFTASTLLTIPNDGFGTYVLRWTETNASPCVSSFDDVEVTFHQQPVANAGLDQEVCGLVAGLEAIPSVGDGFWFIVPSGTQTASFENFDASQTNVTVNEYGTYAFVWEEQNGTVCPADRNTTMVTFYEQPSANAGSDSAVCGLDATLNALTGLGEGFWTALNDNGADVLADSNAYQTAVTAASYGTRLYTWTQINGKACPSSLDTVAIEYVEQPIAFAGFDDRVCGLNYTLRAIPSSGRGRWTSITPGVTFTPDLNTPNASVVVPNEGMYGFVWTEENKLPCQQSSDTVWVEFINRPTGSLQLSTAAICLGDAANLTYLGTGTGPFTVTYSVNGVNSTLNSIANGFNFTVSPSITTIYQIVSITDGSGLSCITNGGQGDTLTVFTRPTGIATGNYAVCNGESATVNLNLTGRPPFVVEMSTGETVTLQGPPYQYTYLPGPNTVRVISISDSVCAGTAGPNLANVTVNPLPVVTIQRATSGNICENDSVLLRLDRIVGTPPYRVFLSEGAWRKDTLLNGSTHLIYTRSLPSGLHTVSIDSIIDANGCKGLGGSISVLVNPRPNVAITSNSPICGGSTAEIRLAFTPANAGPWSLEYTVGSGSSTLTTPPLTAIDTLFFNPVSTTTYQFSRAIDVSTGCSTVLDNLPIIITVIPQPTLAVSVIDPVICANDSAEVELLFTGIAPFSITLNDGTTYAGLNNGDRITVNPTTTFGYTIVQFSDGSGLNCQPSQTVNFNIVVNPIPELSFDVSDTATCFPLIPLFVNTSAATDVSDTSYVWNLGNGETFRGRNPSTSYNQSGEYQITLSATSSNGCTNRLERTISMVLHPYPEANFSYEPEAPTVLAHQVNFTDLSQDAFTFRWTIDGNQISTDPSTTFSFPDDRGGLYDVCLYIESVHGCPDSICRTVRILDEATVFIPSAFTPNGDGLNEVFMPSVLGVDERDYQLIIFDRWGEVVFETTNPKQGWNGEYKSKPAKSDVYTWKVEYKQNDTVERKIKFGTVQLLR